MTFIDADASWARTDGPTPPVAPPDLALGGTIAYAPGRSVYKERDPAEHWYEVVSGAVRACKLLPDGRRQVIEFYLAGDVFGFDDIDGIHSLSTETAAEHRTVMARHLRRRLDARAAVDAGLSSRLRSLTQQSLDRARMRVIVLGSLAAPERVAAFLLEMSDRLPRPAGQGCSDCFALPMARRDIADYLGITAETLSRALHTLRRRRIIALSGQRLVQILDRRLLIAADGRFVPGGVDHTRNVRHQFLEVA